MEETHGNGRYRALCSLETLSSGRKGFFRDFSETVTRVAGEQWIAKVFGRLATDEDRIRMVFTDGKVKAEVLGTLNRTELLYRGKDAAVSRARRLEAFEAATAGERGKALLLSSQAVLRAPVPHGPEKLEQVDRGLGLPLALLARAEILLASTEPALALEDLCAVEEMAARLPHALKLELARKKKECERRVLRANEKGLVAVRMPSVPRDGPRSPTTENKPLPRPAAAENPLLPLASASLEIEETTSAGKRVVASKPIAPGDVLVVEPPIAATLLPDFFGTHCHHCFSRFMAPIGCPDCSSVAFCGRKCRDEAVGGYHRYECKILALLIGSGMSILSMLALRMVTQNGPTECCKIRRALSRRESLGKTLESSSSQLVVVARMPGPHPRANQSKSAKRRSRQKKLRESMRGHTGRTENGAGHPRTDSSENECEESEHGKKDTGERNIDLRAYDLVRHEKKRPAKDFFERSLMAAFLLKCLQRVGFFENCARDDETLTDAEIGVAGLLLRHLQLLQFNAHELFETRHGPQHRFRGSRPVYLGVALYPTVARFNHDCYPAVTRYFVGRSIVIRAIRSLRPGDVVAENYGPIFTKQSLEERRKTLAGRYWFRCECTACRENWPQLDTLTNDHVRLRCPTEGCSEIYRGPRDPGSPVACSSCRQTIDSSEALRSVMDCEQLYARGFAAMEHEQQPGMALEAFFEAANKFHRVAFPPHKDTHLAEIAASACMADEGNVCRMESIQP